MNNNSTYNDTFALSTGCYVLDVFDSGNDGLSFWANNDGNGSLQLRNISGQLIESFEADFGSSIHYEFSVTNSLGLEELNLNQQLNIYPNPAEDKITISTTGFNNGEWKIVDSFGRIINSGTTSSEHVWESEISTYQYHSGIYLFQLYNDDGIQSVAFIRQ